MMRRIGYLVLLAAGICQMMLYDFQGLRFLLCCALCIPAASALLTLPQAFFCKAALRTEQISVSRGDTVKVQVLAKLNAKAMIPVPGMTVRISWKLPGEKEQKTRLRLHGLKCSSVRGNRGVSLKFAASHCGRVQIELNRAVIYDYLGLFSMPVKRDQGVEICIMPVITPIPAGAFATSVGNPWERAGEKEGDLLIREFQPGDSLHRIYWKLVAKDGELQVKDAEKSGVLTLYLAFSDSFRTQAQEWDRYLDRACSLLYFLMEEANGRAQFYVKVVWKKEERFFSQDITEIETLQAWMKLLLLQEEGDLLEDSDIPLLTQGFHLEEDGRLYLGEQCVYEE